MAISTGAAILGGSLISGAAGLISGNKAAKAGEKGAALSAAESARQFDLIRNDTASQRELGQGATTLLGNLYGIGVPTAAQARAGEDVLLGDTYLPAGTTAASPGDKRGSDILFNGRVIGRVNPGGPNGRFVPAAGVDINSLWSENEATNVPASGSPDMSAFFESPDYQFNLQQGQQALDRSLAARGRALSGAGVKEGQRFASGLASQEYGNFTNRLLQMAGIGSAATNTSANAGMQTAANMGNAFMNAGNARASGYLQGGQAINNAAQGGISNLLLSRYLGGAS